MESEKKPANWRYAAVAVIAAIVGGGAVFALAPGEAELNQLRGQRDSLDAQLQDVKQRIPPLQQELKSLQEQNAGFRTEIDRLAATLAEQEQAGAKTSERIGPLQAEVKTLKEQTAALKSEGDRLAATLSEKERALAKASGELAKASSELGERGRTAAQLEERSRALAAENEALKKRLAGAEEKVGAAAAEREALARKLGAAGRTLEDAQAHAAQLDKRYEAMLSEKTTLAERAAERRAQLDKTKQALEAAQAEVARLMGARGIYTVQNGDSLSTIAAFFYRDGSRWPDILKANAHLINHPDLIYPRQILIVPQ